MRHAITSISFMLHSQSRESVTIQITPDITAKAATVAAKTRNKTTIAVLEDWLIERAAEFPLPEEGAGDAPESPAR